MEYKIQIQFVHQTKSKIPFLSLKWPLQGRAFKVGVKIKNIGDNPFGNATIEKILIKSANGQDLQANIRKTFLISTINPDEEISIWFEEIGTYMHGLALIQFEIKPPAGGDIVKTFQKDQFSGICTECGVRNHWVDFFYIQSKNEHTLSNTNTLLLIATILMVMGGLAALGAIMLKLAGWILGMWLRLRGS